MMDWKKLGGFVQAGLSAAVSNAERTADTVKKDYRRKLRQLSDQQIRVAASRARDGEYSSTKTELILEEAERRGL